MKRQPIERFMQQSWWFMNLVVPVLFVAFLVAVAWAVLR